VLGITVALDEIKKPFDSGEIALRGAAYAAHFGENHPHSQRDEALFFTRM